MDIEYTFRQMFHLCTSPKVVYQHTKYHKQTKNQWARDDPAFVMICSLLLTVATLGYCAAFAFPLHNYWSNSSYMLLCYPFLERTTFFLYPIGIVIVLSPILILTGFNPSRYLMNMNFSQRL